MRDIRELFNVEVSLIELKNQSLLISLDVVDCVIKENVIFIIQRSQSTDFIQRFAELYCQTDSFPSFELKCLEAVLFYVCDKFGKVLRKEERTVNSTHKNQNIKEISLIKSQLTELSNDIIQLKTGINQLIDSHEDVVRISFLNQQVEKNQAEPGLKLVKQTTFHTVQYKYTYEQLYTFFDSYRNVLDSQDMRINVLQSKIDTAIQIRQIQLGQKRNIILLFSLFAEIIMFVIGCFNTLGIIMGANVRHFWQPSQGEWDFDRIMAVGFSSAILYVIGCILLVHFKQKRITKHSLF